MNLPPKLEIEHVMPQGWRSHWNEGTPLSAEAAAERDKRISTIGNLTLLTKKLNSALSNRPWTDAEAKAIGGRGPEAGKGKRSLIDTYSLLALSKDLISGHPAAWTDEDIEARTRHPTQKICEVWPGLPTTASTATDPVS